MMLQIAQDMQMVSPLVIIQLQRDTLMLMVYVLKVWVLRWVIMQTQQVKIRLLSVSLLVLKVFQVYLLAQVHSLQVIILLLQCVSLLQSVIYLLQSVQLRVLVLNQQSH